MTPKTLREHIERLSPAGPLTDALERAMPAHAPTATWYSDQKEHWLGWLQQYDGPGAYGRKSWVGRDSQYVYNHIQCAQMLLWLAEASGVPRGDVRAASDAVLAAGPSSARRCAALRRAIPWEAVEQALCTG